MSGNKANLPRLRFPEFREAGAWEEKRLGDCLSRHPEYGINAPAVPYSETLPTYLRITDISEDGHFLENKKSSVAKKVNVENYLLDGDIVLARTGASVGKSYKYDKTDGDLVFAGFLIRVRPDGKKLNSGFFSQFLTTEEYWRWVDFSSARGGQPGINGNEYASLPIPLPSAPEQQKIADCLASLDDLITAQGQKVAALERHKKGLMQQLFPATGQTTPQLRFPEFREAGAWEEKRLGDVAKFTGGGTPSKGNEGYWNGNLPWISSSDISEDSIFDLHPHRFITEQAIKESATKIVPANSILLVSRVGVGKLAISNKPICTSQDFTSLTPMEGNLVFFAYLLKSRKTDLLAFNQGMAIKGFTKDDITKLSVLLPSPPEQQKIAECLTSLDNLIRAEAQKLDALKAHKKGLMQQLFPNPDGGAP